MSDFTFGTAGERRKLTKQSRYGGRGGSTIKGTGEAFHKQLTKRDMTPTQLAAYALTKELEAYASITKDQRHQFKRELGELDQLRSMNMRYLAAALVVLNDAGGTSTIVVEPTPEMFTGSAWDIVAQQLTLATGAETTDIAVRQKEQILVYIVRINIFRAAQKAFREAGIGASNLDEPDPEELPDIANDPVAPGLPLPQEGDEDDW